VGRGGKTLNHRKDGKHGGRTGTDGHKKAPRGTKYCEPRMDTDAELHELHQLARTGSEEEGREGTETGVLDHEKHERREGVDRG